MCAIANYRSIFIKLLDTIKSSNLYASIDKIYVTVLGKFDENNEMYIDNKIEVVCTYCCMRDLA